jgi:hypothetical protein
MPNHIVNVLTIHGSKETVQKVRDFIKGVYEDNEPRLIDFNKLIPMPEALQKSKSSLEINYDNIKNYGYSSWYEFSLDKWGTKWNAYSQKELKPNKIKFETAWSSPEPIFLKLSEQFPKVKFSIAYADEDTHGSNHGKYKIQNGEITQLSMPSDTIAFAKRLHKI